jgi:hypothetical protein
MTSRRTVVGWGSTLISQPPVASNDGFLPSMSGCNVSRVQDEVKTGFTEASAITAGRDFFSAKMMD